jgi:hypothetical protein
MNDRNERARAASIEHDRTSLELDEADVATIEQRARGIPGLRRSVAYLRARYKYPTVPADVALALAAAALGVAARDLGSTCLGVGESLLSPGSVTVETRTFTVEAHELEELDQAVSLGSGRVASLYSKMRSRTSSSDAALALTAQLLGMTITDVNAHLDSHDQYMRWHDGDPGYSVR